ncbi:MAG: nicotinamide mononucleotide transporter, partial [Candidatus Peribacteraceae bacterium]|nr:nicotinamide mononucleotide transporter [Candidatus Peribacteraceae bacterium]
YWIKNKDACKGTGIVSIKTLTPEERAVWPVVVTLAVIVYWKVLGLMGGNLPFADSASTVLSVFAMILMVKRVVESWLLWILVDLISIYMWFYTLIQGGNDISMLVMWSAYLVNAIYGYYNWNKMVTVND